MGALLGYGQPTTPKLEWQAPDPVVHPLEPNGMLRQYLMLSFAASATHIQLAGKRAPLLSWFQSIEAASHTEAPQPERGLSWFQKELERIKSTKASDVLEELRRLVRDHREDRENTILYSQLAFDVLLRKQASIQESFDFLQDSVLDVPEAKNLNKFLEYVSRSPFPTDAFPTICSTVRRALLLGTLQQDDVPCVMEDLRGIAASCFDKEPHQEKLNDALLNAYQSIWHGIMDCRIRADEGIRTEIVQLMMESVSTLPANSQPAALWLSLYRHASHKTGVARYLVRQARSLSPDRVTPAVDLQLGKDLLIAIFGQLRSSQAEMMIISATKLLVEQGKRQRPEEPTWERALNSWLGCLHEFCLNCGERGERIMRSVYKVIAAHVPPTAVVPHLKTMSSGEVCRLLNNYWIPYHVPSQPDAGKALRPPYQARFDWYLERIPSFSNPFAQLIINLARNELPYRTTTTVIFDLVRTMHGAELLLPIVYRLRKRGLTVEPKGAAAAVEVLSAANPRKALYLFKCVRGLWLSRCPTLAVNLIRTNSVMRYVIFAMMKCHDIQIRLPDHRFRHCKRPPLHPLRIELIHKIAYAFAQYTPGDARRAFRNVHYCYRHLVQRKAPLQPLMAKAFVKAGVIRPLQDGQPVHTVKFRWILNIVRELEGEEVADQLDRMVWDWRRSNAEHKREADSGEEKRNWEMEERRRMETGRRWEEMDWEQEGLGQRTHHDHLGERALVRQVKVKERPPPRRRIIGPQTPHTRLEKFGPWDQFL